VAIIEDFNDNNYKTEEEIKEEILMSEDDLLHGLLELGKSKEQTDSFRKIQIKRDGKLYIEFRVRPISEDESQDCWRTATKYAHRNKNEPRRAIETNTSLFRSYVIYRATVEEDRAKIWDNKQAMAAFKIFQGVEMIDRILLAGEKARIIETIDEISGFDNELEDEGKN
jgi:hypothetical protein